MVIKKHGIIIETPTEARHAEPGPSVLALLLAAITYAALWVRRPPQQHWVPTAIALPLLSLGIAFPAVEGRYGDWPVFAVWTLFALGAWQAERRREELERGGAHLDSRAAAPAFH